MATLTLHCFPASLLRVVDGDTLEVSINMGFGISWEPVKVQLLGIDAPEPRGKTREEGLLATEFVKTTLEGKHLAVQAKEKDNFGRTLARVFFREEDAFDDEDAWKCLNDVMVEEEHARPLKPRTSHPWHQF